MNRAKLNYFIDLGLFIAFILVAITGIIKFPLFGLREFYFQYIHKIHDWSGLVLSGLVLIHLILHWKWIKSMTKSFFKKRREDAIRNSYLINFCFSCEWMYRRKL
ncbi:DUF4405 domain-containing protein [archaeon]|nr:DUF4405 domain-containing protein [archaeon]